MTEGPQVIPPVTPRPFLYGLFITLWSSISVFRYALRDPCTRDPCPLFLLPSCRDREPASWTGQRNCFQGTEDTALE